MDQFSARFGGIRRLFGLAAAERIKHAHLCVVGVGGVGSWTVEALARSGVGRLTIVDLDDVCITNVNRQLHAHDGTFGRPKVHVLEERIKIINPDCQVNALHSFFLKSNAEEILAASFSGVVDAIDRPEIKAHLIALCVRCGTPVVTVGGAGGRRNPAAVVTADLAQSSHDPLLQSVRKTLRGEYGFPRQGLFGVEAVFSREPMMYPQADGTVCEDRGTAANLRLDCRSGFGTATFVTGTFGFVAASRLLERIAAPEVASTDGGV